MIPKLYDEKWLREQYVDEFRTLESMAQELGCHKGTVGKALKKLGIEARKRTPRHRQLADREWLYNAYIVDKRSIRNIGAEIGASMGVVREHLKQRGIPIRSVSAGMREAGRISENGRLGYKASNWRGGKRTTGQYIQVYAPDHPRTTKAGYMMEHRLIMEEKLGRYLEPDEVVHHIDGDKHNNHPDNLEVLTQKNHISEHFKNSHEVGKLRKQVKELEEQLKTQIDVRDEYIRQLEEQLEKLIA